MSPIQWRPRPAPPVIDEAETADAFEMARLHAACFSRGWSVEECEALLAQRAVTGFVARRRGWRGQASIAFILARIAADEAEILSIGVDPAARGQGVAGRLIEALLERLSRCGVGRLFLEVEETNAAALALYHRFGFITVGRRRAYYREEGRPGGDALVLRRDAE